MLRAAIFPDFKWCDTLLIWGNNQDISALHDGLAEIRAGKRAVLPITGGAGLTELTIEATSSLDRSLLTGSTHAARWRCTMADLDELIALVDPLRCANTGHQYVDTGPELADQIMIAVNEYAETMRPQASPSVTSKG